MNINKEIVQKLMVTGLTNLDPIAIYLEDQGPGKGKITITCYGQSWTSYWGAMGNRTISEFVCSCDNDYLAKNFSNMPQEVNDLDALSTDMKKTILERRRSKDLDKEEARDYFDQVELSFASEDIINDHALLFSVYGDEWWHSIPTKSNPDYDYLCRILTSTKVALELNKGSVDDGGFEVWWKMVCERDGCGGDEVLKKEYLECWNAATLSIKKGNYAGTI